MANVLLFARVLAYWWPATLAPQNEPRLLRVFGLLGRCSLIVFGWSVLATYLSFALIPDQASKCWRLLDVLMTVSSLIVPALASSRQRSTGSVPDGAGAASTQTG